MLSAELERPQRQHLDRRRGVLRSPRIPLPYTLPLNPLPPGHCRRGLGNQAALPSCSHKVVGLRCRAVWAPTTAARYGAPSGLRVGVRILSPLAVLCVRVNVYGSLLRQSGLVGRQRSATDPDQAPSSKAPVNVIRGPWRRLYESHPLFEDQRTNKAPFSFRVRLHFPNVFPKTNASSGLGGEQRVKARCGRRESIILTNTNPEVSCTGQNTYGGYWGHLRTGIIVVDQPLHSVYCVVQQ